MKCHAPTEKPGKHFPLLDLAGLIKADQKAIIAKDPVHSKLIVSVTRTDEKRMPRKRPALSAEEIDVLKKWIALGCPP